LVIKDEELLSNSLDSVNWKWKKCHLSINKLNN